MSDELARLIIKVDGASAQKAAQQVDQLTKATADAEARVGTLSGRVKRAAGDTEEFRRRTAATVAEWQRLNATQSAAAQKLADSARALGGAGRAADTTAAAMARVRVSSVAADAAMTQAARNALAGLSRLTGVSTTAGGAVSGAFGRAAAGVAGLAGMMVPGGILAAAIAAGTTSIVSMFTNARDELKKTEEEFTTRLDRMRATADGENLTREAFTINQTITEKRTTLRNLEDPNGKTVGDLLRSKSQREQLAREIAALEQKAQRVLQATLNPAAQYSPKSGTPIRVTADSPEAIRKRAADAMKARLDAELEELQGIREFNEFRNGELKERRALAVQAAKAREQEIKSFLLAAGGTIRGVGVGATEGTAGDFVRQANAGAGEALQRAEAMAEEIARRQQQLTQSLADGLQRSLADGIQGGFRNGLRSLNAFGDSLRDTIERSLAEVLASKVLRSLQGALLGDVAGGTGSASRALTTIMSLGKTKRMGAGEFGSASNALAFLGKGGTGAKAASRFTMGGGLLAAGGGFTLGNVAGQKLGTGGGVLAGAATGAALGTIVPGVGNIVGGVVGGLAGALGGLFGGNKKRKAKEDAARALAQDAAAFSEDLIIRTMEAAGDSLGADRKRQEREQKDELAAVEKKFGKNSKEYRATQATQAKEREALNRSAEGELPAGVYQAPAGFDVNAYRFAAGGSGKQQGAMGTTVTTGDVYVTLPQGTTQKQVDDFLRELTSRASQQGVSRWSEVYAQ